VINANTSDTRLDPLMAVSYLWSQLMTVSRIMYTVIRPTVPPFLPFSLSSLLFQMPQGAAERWQSIITQGSATSYPAGSIDWTFGQLGPNFSYFGPVEDIVIFYRITDLGGQGGVLGRAGPLETRRLPGESPHYSPISALMEFDYRTFLLRHTYRRLF
jgi:hypothetical protein